MEILFSKYSGSGNDFVIIDNRELKIKLDPNQIKLICDRKQGVGSDGIILAEPGSKSKIKMRIFNSDGSEAEMCGNGLRCLSHFLDMHSIKSPTIESIAGLHSHEKQGLGIRTSMSDPVDLRQNIQLSEEIVVDYIDTGVPHAVYFVDDVDSIDILKLGSFIRHHPILKPRGANANFVQLLGTNKIRVRTYERGVEGETLACGTGVTAAAILSALKFNLNSPIETLPQSNESIIIEFQWDGKKPTHVTMTGPARLIFQGSFHLKDHYATESTS